MESNNFNKLSFMYGIDLHMRDKSYFSNFNIPKAPKLSFTKSRNHVPKLTLDEGSYENKSETELFKRKVNMKKKNKESSKDVIKTNTISVVKKTSTKDLLIDINSPMIKTYHSKPLNKRSSILQKLTSTLRN